MPPGVKTNPYPAYDAVSRADPAIAISPSAHFCFVIYPRRRELQSKRATAEAARTYYPRPGGRLRRRPRRFEPKRWHRPQGRPDGRADGPWSRWVPTAPVWLNAAGGTRWPVIVNQPAKARTTQRSPGCQRHGEQQDTAGGYFRGHRFRGPMKMKVGRVFGRAGP